MTTKPKKMGMFSSIEAREDALKMARSAGHAFLFVAALNVAMGLLMQPSAFVDAIALTVLGVILVKWHSRVAAVLLLLISLGQGAVTVLNRLGVTSGGKNIFLAIIMVIVAVRAVEATFKLHGRFANPSGPLRRRVAA
jgi:hypothetical protein